MPRDRLYQYHFTFATLDMPVTLIWFVRFQLVHPVRHTTDLDIVHLGNTVVNEGYFIPVPGCKC